MRGPHKSALVPDAIQFLRDEATEKVHNNYAKIVTYGDIRNSLPSNFKVSPVSMVPHKSKLYRTILDLTFRLRKKMNKREKYESVNSATTKLAPQQAMGQLGSVVRRIVAVMAEHFDPSMPFMFTKLDIKDGFWRMAVSDSDAWNFCYALPSESPQDLEDIEIVVPNSLQMGWTESPPCFCAGTETARDLMEIILPTAQELNVHPLELSMMPLLHELQASKKMAAMMICRFLTGMMTTSNRRSQLHTLRSLKYLLTTLWPSQIRWQFHTLPMFLALCSILFMPFSHRQQSLGTKGKTLSLPRRLTTEMAVGIS